MRSPAAVYKGAQKFLSLVMQEGTTDMKELFGFLHDTQDAFFLFRPDMADYLIGLYRKGVDLRTTREIYADPWIGFFSIPLNSIRCS